MNKSWTCIAHGNPRLTVTWHVNGGTVGEGYAVHEKAKDLGNGYQIESTITMVGIKRNKSSLLSCNASNAIGSITSLAYIIISCKYLTILYSTECNKDGFSNIMAAVAFIDTTIQSDQ